MPADSLTPVTVLVRALLLVFALTALTTACGSANSSQPSSGTSSTHALTLQWEPDVTSADFTSCGLPGSLPFGVAEPLPINSEPPNFSRVSTCTVYWVSNYTGSDVVYSADIEVPDIPYTDIVTRQSDYVIYQNRLINNYPGCDGRCYPVLTPSGSIDGSGVNLLGKSSAIFIGTYPLMFVTLSTQST